MSAPKDGSIDETGFTGVPVARNGKKAKRMKGNFIMPMLGHGDSADEKKGVRSS